MILYIGNILSRHGGSVSVIENLAPRLSSDFSVKAYSSKKNKLLRLLDMLYAVFRHRNSTNFILVDAYSSPLAFTYTLCVSLLCRCFHLSYIPILHGGDFPNRLQRWPILCRFVFSNSYVNVAPSGYLKDAFTKGNFKTVLIPNAIDLSLYPCKFRKNIDPSLLWVRAFHQATYNPLMAIRAFHLLAKQYPDAQLCMVGHDKDGSMATCKELAVRLGVSDKVVFKGKLSKADWIALSAQYDVFINTTNFDNTPVSVIEAMALGLPVVSTNVGGIPYLIENEVTGLLSPPGDIEHFKDQLLKLLEHNYLAEKLSLEGRTKAETFSWERVKPLWLNLLTANERV